MDIIRTLDAVTPDQTGSIAAIGNFDGVHLGHRAVIGEAGRLAKESGHKLSVLTFEPHPRAFFQPDGIPFRLTSSQTRAAKLASIGIDLLFELPFDRAFAEITAEDFVDRVLFKELDFAHVVVGYDFNYGHRAVARLRCWSNARALQDEAPPAWTRSTRQTVRCIPRPGRASA